MRLILNWLVNAAALYATTRILPGVRVVGLETLLVAALAIGLINAIIRPILRFVTFPITVVTLGLFYFVLNGAMFYLAAYFTPGFAIDSFVTAVLGAIVMSLVATVLHLFVKPKKKKKR
ncbi:MAG: phage holin family protein [Gemmatimonadetes bacterium]|nr:phage holin family protein [Gemmatimonadota bacterium]